MLYRYNYSYLPEWMEANAQLPVNTILQAIGSKSNNSLRSWEQKLCAMPIVTLLRFCNSFQIPIEAFICNTGDPFKDKVYIPTSAQFEPDGGCKVARHLLNGIPHLFLISYACGASHFY